MATERQLTNGEELTRAILESFALRGFHARVIPNGKGKGGRLYIEAFATEKIFNLALAEALEGDRSGIPVEITIKPLQQ